MLQNFDKRGYGCDLDLLRRSTHMNRGVHILQGHWVQRDKVFVEDRLHYMQNSISIQLSNHRGLTMERMQCCDYPIRVKSLDKRFTTHPHLITSVDHQRMTLTNKDQFGSNLANDSHWM